MNRERNAEAEIFNGVFEHNVELELCNGRLIYRGKESIPQPFIEQLRGCKDRVCQALSAQQSYLSSQGAITYRDGPASWCEHAVWAASQISGNPAAFRPLLCLQFSERLEDIPLANAFRHLLSEEPILRARFILDEPSMLLRRLVVADVPTIEIVSIDNRSEIVPLLHREIHREVDVSREALCKAFLFRPNDNRDVLAVVFHHLIIDGWSTRLYIERLSELYRLYCSGEARAPEIVGLPQKAMNPIDILEDPAFALAKAFWLTQFKSFPKEKPVHDHIVELEGDRNTQLYKYTLPSEKRRELVELCRHLGCTVSEIWLSVFLVNLRLSIGSQGLIINTVFHNRQTQETQKRFGTFSTELPLIFSSIAEKSFSQIVADVRTTSSGVQRYQFFPRYALQRLLQAEFGVGQIPLYDKFHYVFQKIADGQTWGKSNVAGTVDIGAIEEDVPLKFVVQEIGNEIALEVKGDGSVFNEVDFAVFSGRFESLLTLFCNRPDAIAERCIESALDAELSRFNDEGVSLVADVRRVAHDSPDAVALCSAGAETVYSRLVSLVDLYQSELSARGVQEGDRVALVLNPCVRGIALMLALIERKISYVPIDPLSSETYRQILYRSADVTYVVSEQTPEAELVFESRTIESAHKLRRTLAGELAVIFTSGSTGVPKGVRCSVASLAHRRDVLRSSIPVSSRDIVYVKSPMSVVDFVIECLSSLRVGACLVIPTVDERRDPFSLAELCERHQVTKLEVVPSQFRGLLPEIRRKLGQSASLRTLVFTGEAFPEDLLQEILTLFPSASIYNRYGLTEAAAAVVTEISAHRIPCEVGCPTPGVSIKVVPSVATGDKPGDVFIAGKALALGYVNQTWRRYSLDGAVVWFATGEKGWISDDGMLFIKGRTDHEVKVRGFRVNLSEVESVLQAHPEVKRAVVTMRRASRDPELVGLVEIASAGAMPHHLKEHLRAYLPHHAVPGRLVCIPKLPETVGGKIDRTKCQSIIEEVAQEVTQATQVSADLNGRVLGLVSRTSQLFTGCTVHSDLLEMGADSLVLARLVQMIRREFGVRVPLKHIYTHPTISALIDRISIEADNYCQR